MMLWRPAVMHPDWEYGACVFKLKNVFKQMLTFTGRLSTFFLPMYSKHCIMTTSSK